MLYIVFHIPFPWLDVTWWLYLCIIGGGVAAGMAVYAWVVALLNPAPATRATLGVLPVLGGVAGLAAAILWFRLVRHVAGRLCRHVQAIPHAGSPR